MVSKSKVQFNDFYNLKFNVLSFRAKVKKIQKKQLKDGLKPKDTESQEESENESKISLKIKDENSREFPTLKNIKFIKFKFPQVQINICKTVAVTLRVEYATQIHSVLVSQVMEVAV